MITPAFLVNRGDLPGGFTEWDEPITDLASAESCFAAFLYRASFRYYPHQFRAKSIEIFLQVFFRQSVDFTRADESDDMCLSLLRYLVAEVEMIKDYLFYGEALKLSFVLTHGQPGDRESRPRLQFYRLMGYVKIIHDSVIVRKDLSTASAQLQLALLLPLLETMPIMIEGPRVIELIEVGLILCPSHAGLLIDRTMFLLLGELLLNAVDQEFLVEIPPTITAQMSHRHLLESVEAYSDLDEPNQQEYVFRVQWIAENFHCDTVLKSWFDLLVDAKFLWRSYGNKRFAINFLWTILFPIAEDPKYQASVFTKDLGWQRLFIISTFSSYDPFTLFLLVYSPVLKIIDAECLDAFSPSRFQHYFFHRPLSSERCRSPLQILWFLTVMGHDPKYNIFIKDALDLTKPMFEDLGLDGMSNFDLDKLCWGDRSMTQRIGDPSRDVVRALEQRWPDLCPWMIFDMVKVDRYPGQMNSYQEHYDPSWAPPECCYKNTQCLDSSYCYYKPSEPLNMASSSPKKLVSKPVRKRADCNIYDDSDEDTSPGDSGPDRSKATNSIHFEASTSKGKSPIRKTNLKKRAALRFQDDESDSFTGTTSTSSNRFEGPAAESTAAVTTAKFSVGFWVSFFFNIVLLVSFGIWVSLR